MTVDKAACPTLSRRVRKIPAKVRWWWARHITYPWWSFQNFRKGYRWCAIQRCRRCDHTSPYHYSTCVNYTTQDNTDCPVSE